LFFISVSKKYFILINIEQESELYMSSSEYQNLTSSTLDPNLMAPTIGGRSRRYKRSKSPVRPSKRVPKRSKSPVRPAKRAGKKGKKGGVDLTPFLTSLLLLGSKVVLDKKRSSSPTRRNRRFKKRVGGEAVAVETISGKISKFENPQQDQELLLPPTRGGNASQMSDLVNSVLNGGKKKRRGGNPAQPPNPQDVQIQGGMLDFFTNKEEKEQVKSQEGGRKHKKSAKKIVKKSTKPVKKVAKKPVKKSTKRS